MRKLATNNAVDLSAAGGLAPTGSVMTFAATTAPTGWLLCDGSAISRTIYVTLFAVIGTTYGTGDGSTTFNVPDIRGRVIAGLDNMGGSAASRLTNTVLSASNTMGATGGAQTHTLTVAQMPSHTHTMNNFGTVDTDVAGSNGFVLGQASADTAGGGRGNANTGGDTAHTNTQPTIVLSYIIKT